MSLTLKIFIILTVGFLAGIYFFYNFHSALNTSIERAATEEDDARSSEAYWDDYRAAVVAQNDPDFTKFVLFDLQAKCPFYKPDGTSYRECITHLVNEEIGGFKRGSSAVGKIESDCNNRAAQYMDNLTNTALSLDLSCQVYKFSSR